MFANEIDYGSTPELKYGDVVLKRRTARYLDPSFKVEREEVFQIIREALSFTPNGANAQPYRFLLVDTDEGKRKIDSMMRGVDVGRPLACSFIIIPMYDRNYIDKYDELMEMNMKTLPEKYTPEHVAALKAGVANAAAEMMEDGGVGFERFLSFETGIACMSILLTIRAHGLDAGFVTDWNVSLMADEFGLDLDRYCPMGTIAVGKSIGPVFDCFRYEAEGEMSWFID